MSAHEGSNITTKGSCQPASQYGGDESYGSGSEDASNDMGTAQVEQQEHDEHSVHNLSSEPADCQRSQSSR